MNYEEELEQLQGTWVFDSLEVEGQKLPDPMYRGSTLEIEGDVFITRALEATYEGKLQLKPKTAPKTIDMIFTGGPEKGKTSLGIYEVDGDTLKICLGFTGVPRPQAFLSKPGTGHAFEILRRKTPGA